MTPLILDVTQKKESPAPTPATAAKTTGEAKPVPKRRAGRSAGSKESATPDPVMAQAQGTQALVAAMPHNANKARDSGRDNALMPPVGLTAEPAFDAVSNAVSASTLSEGNASAKTGEAALPGLHATDGRLSQARVDGSGHVLTTNQGVAIADNQNSLRPACEGRRCLKTSSCAKRSRTLTTSAFLNASCMHAARRRTATSKPMKRSPT